MLERMTVASVLEEEAIKWFNRYRVYSSLSALMDYNLGASTILEVVALDKGVIPSIKDLKIPRSLQ